MNFQKLKKEIKHLSHGPTWICQNLTRLSAAITWEIDLKRGCGGCGGGGQFKDECLRCQHLLLSTIHTTEYFTFFFFFPSSLPFLCPVWLTRTAEGARVWRGPPRHDKDCATLMCVCACMCRTHMSVRQEEIGWHVWWWKCVFSVCVGHSQGD